jgi:uncharacterized protein YecE (DUF72 family)
MKFGKLHDLSQVDFRLPPLNADNKVILGGSPSSAGFQPFVGCPMWGNKGWVGKLYPKGVKAADYLSYYSQSFNTIELNSTHYRIPTHEISSRWYDMAAEGFEFCPKIPQTISHYRKLINCEEEIQRFADSVSLFGEKMGCAFVQLHPTFGPNLIRNLAWFLDTFPDSIPLAIEFRHEEWFQNHRLIPEAEDLLMSNHTAAVITDVAGRRDVLHTSLTNKIAMIRFVGNQLIDSDYTRADAWMERIAHWVDYGLEKLYFFVHEPDDTFAPEMGTYVIKKLNQRFGLDLTIPGIPQAPGTQMELF